jgi:hypothetical protein
VCVMPHHITSHHITSHHITSHHITSHHITSHHITGTFFYVVTPPSLVTVDTIVDGSRASLVLCVLYDTHLSIQLPSH